MRKINYYKRSRRFLLAGMLALALAGFLWLTFAYLVRANFTEPVYIKAAFSNNANINFHAYGVSPTGREFELNTDSTIGEWKKYYGFYIGFVFYADESSFNQLRYLDISSGHFQIRATQSEISSSWTLEKENGRVRINPPLLLGNNTPLLKKAVIFFTRNQVPLAAFCVFFTVILILLLYRYLILGFLGLAAFVSRSFRQIQSLLPSITKIKNLTHRIRKKKAIRASVIILLVVYLVLAMPSAYLLLFYGMSGTLSGFLFIAGCGILLYILIRVVTKRWRTRFRQLLVIPVLLLYLLWTGAEIWFRSTGRYDTYNEREGLFYQSGFSVKSLMGRSDPWMLYNVPGSSYVDVKPEFSYEISYNSEGLRDKDYPVEKSKGEYRVVCIGNSFTEGVGAAQDSTWPKFLERSLDSHCRKGISVINAGIRGSDPCFEYYLLEKKMLKWSPDLVVLSIGPSDIKFIINRGGMERFLPGGGLKYREGPGWEWLYAISHTFRYVVREFFDYSDMLRKKSETENEIKRAKKNIELAVEQFRDLSEKKSFRLMVVFFPTADQVSNGDFVFQDMYESLRNKKTAGVFSLLDYYKGTVGMDQNNVHRYYWEQDGHHNARGYEVFAKGVEFYMRQSDILDSLCAGAGEKLPAASGD